MPPPAPETSPAPPEWFPPTFYQTLSTRPLHRGGSEEHLGTGGCHTSPDSGSYVGSWVSPGVMSEAIWGSPGGDGLELSSGGVGQLSSHTLSLLQFREMGETTLSHLKFMVANLALVFRYAYQTCLQ